MGQLRPVQNFKEQSSYGLCVLMPQTRVLTATCRLKHKHQKMSGDMLPLSEVKFCQPSSMQVWILENTLESCLSPVANKNVASTERLADVMSLLCLCV